MDCTSLDHSGYKVSTNFWGLERSTQDLEVCLKCGKPEFGTWWKRIQWKSKDRKYWIQIFQEAMRRDAFFYRPEPIDYLGHYRLHVDADEDPAKVRFITRPPKLWRGKTLIDEILQYRYSVRLQTPKVHHYAWRQPFIRAAIKLMLMEINDSCIDNTRFAAVDSNKDMKRYWKQAARGCCGRHDEIVSVFGRKFMIGCNYGH